MLWEMLKPYWKFRLNLEGWDINREKKKLKENTKHTKNDQKKKKRNRKKVLLLLVNAFTVVHELLFTGEKGDEKLQTMLLSID